MTEPASHPPEAYASNGTLWWLLDHRPGTQQRFGGEPRLAAWITFNCRPNDVVTMRQLRAVLPTEPGQESNAQEHFNRRWRELRKYGYVIHSHQDDGTLRPEEYRIVAIGHPIWLGKAQFTSKKPSAKVRRAVFDRDGNRCVICGVGANEEYPDLPGQRAVLTLGHVKAESHQGAGDMNNLRTECSRCNEPVRAEAASSEVLEVLLARMRILKSADKRRILGWLEGGQRTRDDVDVLYDQIRVLPAAQRDTAQQALARATRES